MKSTLSTNDGAATEELNEEKPKPLEPSLVHDENFQPTETTRLSGVKVRWSQGRQFLKLNTDVTFNFTKNATRRQFDGRKIWRENWRNRTNTYIGLFGARSF